MNNLVATEINFISSFRKFPFDIFLKLSPEKFVKLVNKEEEISELFFERYTKKGCTEVWVDKSSLEKFKKKVLVKDKLQEEDNQSIANSMYRQELEVQTVGKVRELVKCIGVSDIAIELADSCIESTLATLEKKFPLFGIIQNCLQGKDYLSEHSIMIPYIASAINDALGWGSFATLEKITIAAFLHDIRLENEDIEREDCKNIKELKKKYDRQDVENYQEHPLLAIELIDRFAISTPNVADIIHVHHELPDGTGFPRGLHAPQISPLACSFIIAEKFVNEIYGTEISPEIISNAAELISSTYTQGNFKPQAKIMAKLFVKK